MQLKYSKHTIPPPSEIKFNVIPATFAQASTLNEGWELKEDKTAAVIAEMLLRNEAEMDKMIAEGISELLSVCNLDEADIYIFWRA